MYHTIRLDGRRSAIKINITLTFNTLLVAAATVSDSCTTYYSDYSTQTRFSYMQKVRQYLVFLNKQAEGQELMRTSK